MDSFYDAPRKPVIPTPIQRFSDTPLVPEVSLIAVSKPSGQCATTYDSWKAFKGSNDQGTDIPGLDRQVRFQNHSKCAQRKDKISETCCSNIPTNCGQFSSEEKKLPVFNKATFEEVYMANIPNRLLDLSLITDAPQNEKQNSLRVEKTEGVSNATNNNKQNLVGSSSPKTYKQYRSSVQKRMDERLDFNDSVTDILNYKRNDKKAKSSEINKKLIKTPTHEELAKNNTKTELRNKHNKINVTSSSHTDNFLFEPDFKQCNFNNYNNNNTGSKKTVTSTSVQTDMETEPNNHHHDLLKIIQQQNDQIIILQKQVASLIEQQSSKPECPACSSTQHDRDPRTPCKAHGPRSKFSMTTSFEVSFRPQQNLFQKRHNRDLEPRIQELTESESIDSEPHRNDPSLYLQEPLFVPENCPSPEPSIKIDMKDYESDEDTNIDMSFYSNLMHQITNVLNKADIQTNVNVEAPQKEPTTRRKDTMKLVKEATMKRLKTVGVDIPSTDGEQFPEKAVPPSDINFAVKQLLIKYLPDDYLAKAAKQKEPILQEHSRERGHLIQTRPEFSIATVQYMKKYNLLAGADDCQRNEVLQNRNCLLPKVKAVQKNCDPNKILDITAIKQQPKLL